MWKWDNVAMGFGKVIEGNLWLPYIAGFSNEYIVLSIIGIFLL
jgi:hypothetical protein